MRFLVLGVAGDRKHEPPQPAGRERGISKVSKQNKPFHLIFRSTSFIPSPIEREAERPKARLLAQLSSFIYRR